MARRIGAAFALVALLLTFAAPPVFGHHVVSIGCDGEKIKVVANVFAGHTIKVIIDGDVVMNEAVPGADSNHTYTFVYDGGPASVTVKLYNGSTKEDEKSAEVNCFTATPSPTPSPTPTPTPEIGQFSAQVAPCPNRTSNISGIRFIGVLLLLHVKIDGIEVMPDLNGDVAVVPGHHSWQVLAQNGVTVLAAGEIDCPTCNSTETPLPSLPNTSSNQNPISSVLSLIGVLVLLVSLGALAVANARYTGRRV